MLVLSNINAQLLQPGQSITFDKVILDCGYGECFNSQSPKSAKLCAKGVYALSFSGNVTSGTVGDQLQLAIAVGNQPLIYSAMNATVSTANGLENISTEIRYRNCCCDMDRVSIINTGAVPVTIAPNSAFVIDRRG